MMKKTLIDAHISTGADIGCVMTLFEGFSFSPILSDDTFLPRRAYPPGPGATMNQN
jgi:hypothetical protein